MHLEPGEHHPVPQLRHHIQFRVARAAERRVMALALRVVLPPVDVHRARPLEAGHPIRHEIVEPQVAHLQPRNLIDPQAPQRGHRRQEPSAVRGQRGRPPCEEPTHRCLLDGKLQRHGATPNRPEHLGPRRELVGLTQRRRQMELAVPGLHGLPDQLDLRGRHGKTNQVPCQCLQRLRRHRQNRAQRLTGHPPCDDQAPGSPVVRPCARLPDGWREMPIELGRQGGDRRPSAASRRPQPPSCRAPVAIRPLKRRRRRVVEENAPPVDSGEGGRVRQFRDIQQHRQRRLGP